MIAPDQAYRLLKLTPVESGFRPQHAHNLANEFAAFTNYGPVTL